MSDYFAKLIPIPKLVKPREKPFPGRPPYSPTLPKMCTHFRFSRPSAELLSFLVDFCTPQKSLKNRLPQNTSQKLSKSTCFAPLAAKNRFLMILVSFTVDALNLCRWLSMLKQTSHEQQEHEQMCVCIACEHSDLSVHSKSQSMLKQTSHEQQEHEQMHVCIACEHSDQCSLARASPLMIKIWAQSICAWAEVRTRVLHCC